MANNYQRADQLQVKSHSRQIVSITDMSRLTRISQKSRLLNEKSSGHYNEWIPCGTRNVFLTAGCDYIFPTLAEHLHSADNSSSIGPEVSVAHQFYGYLSQSPCRISLAVVVRFYLGQSVLGSVGCDMNLWKRISHLLIDILGWENATKLNCWIFEKLVTSLSPRISEYKSMEDSPWCRCSFGVLHVHDTHLPLLQFQLHQTHR